MMETDIPVTKDSSGCIFIDRSAKHFDKILNFMRDGNVVLLDSIEMLKEIQNEARYYLLEGLVELCSVEINKTVSQKPEDEIQVIETDTELIRIMNRKSGKPALIIYFFIGMNGRTIPPAGFYTLMFINKYKHKLDIYMRAHRDPQVYATADETRWRWSLHYCDGYSYQAPKHKKDYNSNENPESFEDQLVKSINEFFVVQNIVI